MIIRNYKFGVKLHWIIMITDHNKSIQKKKPILSFQSYNKCFINKKKKRKKRTKREETSIGNLIQSSNDLLHLLLFSVGCSISLIYFIGWARKKLSAKWKKKVLILSQTKIGRESVRKIKVFFLSFFNFFFHDSLWEELSLLD